MQKQATALFTVAALICLIPAAGHAQITPYSQDFEALIQPLPSALSGDGWRIYGNVFDDLGVWQYGYGEVAPNHSLAFCQITLGEGGEEQGLQQLSVFSDYENGDHALGWLIESNVFQEWTIDATNVGETWVFDYAAKMGNLELDSTAAVFIKTIDPSNNYAMTNFVSDDVTSISTEWTGGSLQLDIIPELVGQFFQVGFMNTATNYEGSGIIYDNLDLHLLETDVPDGASTIGAALRQNYPNPFNPSTRIEFALERGGAVDISVYDLAGRRVATLQQGVLDVGEHSVTWDGRSDDGGSAPAGQYNYVLKTPSGRIARSMVLLK